MKAFVPAGLLAGLFDICWALGLYSHRGIPPARILKSISSGLLGKDALTGGPAIAALGLVLHFALALIAAAFYYAVSRRIPALAGKWAIPGGILYGAGWLVLMNSIVLPLSRFPCPPHYDGAGLFAHTILFGLTIALVIRHQTAQKPVA